jgi:hypothetical protein
LSAVRITLQQDTLPEEFGRFQPQPLRAPIFLNGVPKCGTHLIRNIMRMFVAPERHYHGDFIQLPSLSRHVTAFDPSAPWLSWGHLVFADTASVALARSRHVVLVRDPYDWVLARARFFLSDQFNGPLNNVKNGAAPLDDVLNLMIFGALDKAPSLADIFTFNAVAWANDQTLLLRYEDLTAAVKDLEGPAASALFKLLFEHCQLNLPEDWRERVRVGADRKHSATSREKLSGDLRLPDVLPERQRRLVNFAAPGLREMLGYA